MADDIFCGDSRTGPIHGVDFKPRHAVVVEGPAHDYGISVGIGDDDALTLNLPAGHSYVVDFCRDNQTWTIHVKECS